MTLTSIALKGFKSFVNKELPLKQLTLLTGINSSGKSSVIQALRMLERYNKDIKNPGIPGYGSMEELRNNQSQWPIELVTGFEDGSNTSLLITENNVTGKKSKFPELTYISASRLGPQNMLPIAETEGIGELGENVLKSIEIYQDKIVPEIIRHPDSHGDTLYFNLRGWLTSIAPGVKFDHEIIKLADAGFMKFNGFRAMNVGFGLSYTFPVIASLLLASVKKNQLVLIENPEAHLHPKGQTELAFLVCKAVETGAQVIVETHSDHFFDGVRVYVKRHSHFADQTSIHWYELKDGVSHVEVPEIKPTGNLSFWPKGLFDQFETNADALL